MYANGGNVTTAPTAGMAYNGGTAAEAADGAAAEAALALQD